jgi:NADP-dependent 3-hydroxy acid dehydrogenase YdfG
MPAQELSGTTALVTGASWGSGRATAVALPSCGAHVAGVARDPGRLEELHAQLGGTFTPSAPLRDRLDRRRRR